VLLVMVEKVLRGALSRWLLELRPGTFLGSPSPRVRDELWQKVTQRPPPGYALQVWSAPGPQGFEYRQHGSGGRRLVDFEGLALVSLARKPRRKKGVDNPPENPP
jgi:CRISPR-associated protein Cas2